METANKNEMTVWYRAKIDLLNEELKRIESGVAPDYIQDRDLLGKELKRSEIIKSEIDDFKIALESK